MRRDATDGCTGYIQHKGSDRGEVAAMLSSTILNL